MKHIKITIIAISFSAFLCGCSSTRNQQTIPQYIPFQQEYRNASWYSQPCISSIPNGAKIFINGIYTGETPAMGLSARKGDHILIYFPGYEAAYRNIESDAPININVPLMPSSRRHFDLLENAKAKFVSDGKHVFLESTKAPASKGNSFVIFDPTIGRDVKLSVLESNPVYIKFRSDDGIEFSYPVYSPEHDKSERISAPSIRKQANPENCMPLQFRSGLPDESNRQIPILY